jgi:hypothetical protein
MQKHRFVAGLIAVAAAALPLAAHAQTTPAPAPAPAPAAPSQIASQLPVPLFKAVCIDGTARLSKKWATATSYSALPATAKAAFGHADADVPNPVFQIGGGNEYLILPAPASGPAFADGCAVVWQGDDLAQAKTIPPIAPAGLAVTAGASKGWTVLKSLPRPPAATPAPADHR